VRSTSAFIVLDWLCGPGPGLPNYTNLRIAHRSKKLSRRTASSKERQKALRDGFRLAPRPLKDPDPRRSLHPSVPGRQHLLGQHRRPVRTDSTPVLGAEELAALVLVHGA
jgi:hypothetical protein